MRIATSTALDLPIVTTSAGERRVVRLITFLAGTPLDRTASTAPQRERIGEVLAKLRHAMADFSHPADSRTLAWDVTHLLDLSDLLGFIPAGGKRAWTIRALERFARDQAAARPVPAAGAPQRFQHVEPGR